MKVTPRQYERMTALHFDPLLAERVELVGQPSRVNGEVDAADFWKEEGRRKGWLLDRVCRSLLVFALFGVVVAQVRPVDAGHVSASCPTLQEGSTGYAVTELQYRLRAGGWVLAVDGTFGSRTKHVVTRFQQMSGLYADGIAGPRTQRALGCGQPAPTSQPAPTGRPAVEQWRSLALEVGWPADMWPWLSCVIWRESKGIPTVVYRASRDRSYGLMQINALAHSKAMIEFAGSEEAFLDPRVNLSFAYRLFQAAGKSPWYSRTKPC